MMYRVISSDPADAGTLALFAPKPLILRGANGVCLDIARHLRGTPSVVSVDGAWHGDVIEQDMKKLRAHRAGLGDGKSLP